jgi:hypothetical protein
VVLGRQALDQLAVVEQHAAQRPLRGASRSAIETTMRIDGTAVTSKPFVASHAVALTVPPPPPTS